MLIRRGLALASALLLATAANAVRASDLDEGYRAFEQRSYRRAEELLRTAAAEGDPQAHSLLARIAYFYGRYDEARARLAQAPAGDPHAASLSVMLENPFEERFGERARLLEGRSPLGRYHVVTDLGATDDALRRLKAGRTTAGHREVASLLELVHDAYDGVFKLEKDEDLVSRVIVFARREDFLAFGKRCFEQDMSQTAAFYDPNTHTLVVGCAAAPAPGRSLDGETQHAIFHEAFHQFVDFYVPECPHWFNEGMAEYFGPSQVLPGGKKLRVGALQNKRAGFGTNHERIREAIRKAEHTPLRDLLGLDAAPFMAKADLHYSQSWAFCHFLVHGIPDGRGKKMLATYFRTLREGKGRAAAFEAAFARVDLVQLERQWREYVGKLKA